MALAQAFWSWNSVQITLVDCNASSLTAARQYAEQVLGVDDSDDCDDTIHRINRKIHFVEADFGAYRRDATHPPPTLVVALHACGDLSDAALDYAVDHRCAFCICPCCYTKRYIANFVPPYLLQHQAMLDQATRDCTDPRTALTILGKLAETDERPDLLRRAAIVINAMRLRSIPNNNFDDDDDDTGNNSDYSFVRLEEYDPDASSRNLVLVGMPKS